MSIAPKVGDYARVVTPYIANQDDKGKVFKIREVLDNTVFFENVEAYGYFTYRLEIIPAEIYDTPLYKALNEE